MLCGTPFLEPVPHIGEMDREASWCNQYHIDPRVFAVGAILRIKNFHRSGDAPEPVKIDRLLQIFQLGARLDLDKGDQPAAPGYQVDLAARGAHPLGQNTPTLETQEPGGDFFGVATALLGSLAFHFEGAVCAEPVDAPFTEKRPSTGSGRTEREP